MEREPPKLDYATPPNIDSRPPHPALLVIGILLLLIGSLAFLLGVGGVAAGLGAEPFRVRWIAFAIVGAFAYWLGMKLKSNRPAG